MVETKGFVFCLTVSKVCGIEQALHKQLLNEWNKWLSLKTETTLHDLLESVGFCILH